MLYLSRLTRFLVTVVGVYLITFFLLRLGFWLYFRNPNEPLGAGKLIEALYIGMKFDLRLALWLILPIYLLTWFKPFNPYTNRYAKYAWFVYLGIATTVVGLFYVFDFGYFAYLHVRIDNTILRFLENAAISADMVLESYHVVPVLIVFAVAVAVTIWGFRRLFDLFHGQPRKRLGRLRRFAIGTVVTFLLLFGMYGKFSWYPLRWSDAVFSTNAFATAVAANPVLYFVDTLRNGGEPYDTAKVRRDYPLMAKYFDVDRPDIKTLDFTRRVFPQHGVGKNPNVVVVLLESFAFYKSSLSGNPLNPSPVIANLAKNGIYFDQFYTPTTGTARGVFNTLTSIADVQLGDTSSMNPTVVDQHTVATAFKDYQKYYFIGGSANWRNIRGMLQHNIPGLRIFEEGSYDAPRIDVWGISDLDLFRAANKEFARVSKQSEPFFAIVQTSGNHRPYTVPADNDGFIELHPPEERVRQYGFESAKELNSFSFLDHSVGSFIKLAKKEPYFKNTLFVFFGDHGIAGYPGQHRPKLEGQLLLGSYHTPLVIYGPGLVKPARYDKVVSQVDVLPTLASLAGKPYLVKGMGRDMLDPKYDDWRYNFSLTNIHNPTFTLTGENYIYQTRGGIGGLFSRKEDNPSHDVSGDYPEVAQKMKALANGIYQTARYMINHNKSEPQPDTADAPKAVAAR